MYTHTHTKESFDILDNELIRCVVQSQMRESTPLSCLRVNNSWSQEAISLV